MIALHITSVHVPSNEKRMNDHRPKRKLALPPHLATAGLQSRKALPAGGTSQAVTQLVEATGVPQR